MTSPANLRQLQREIWSGCVPVEIRLASAESNTYDQGEPYLVLCPRVSYLPLLLPKLHSFFRAQLINEDVLPHQGWFSFENVPLKWHFPVGLLFDIYSGHSDHLQDDNGHSVKKDSSLTDAHAGGSGFSRTWSITLHFDDWPSEVLVKVDDIAKSVRDAFTNSYKEASYVRFSSTKVVQRLSLEDSLQYWDAVVKHDFDQYAAVDQKLRRPRDAELKHIPIKIYLPLAASDDDEDSTTPGHLRIIQGLVAPQVSQRQPQTLGTALNSLIPSLFPSRRMPLLAQPVLHGAIVPLGISLETLSEIASYADSYIHLTVAMIR